MSNTVYGTSIPHKYSSFILFVPKTREIGSTGEPWELAGVHVNVDKLELLFAWQNILSRIFSEGEKCKFPFLSHQDFPWGVPGPPLLINTDAVGTLGEQRILFLLCHGVSTVSSVSGNHAEQITWACTPNGLLHEVPSWANIADKVVYNHTVINCGTNESKGK